MDNYIIAAGGTGAMCARAFIYMAAAGCANNGDTYHILLMDKDKQSDAMTACENLLKDYEAMREQMGLKPGTYTFPAIKVHRWNFTDEIVDEHVKQTGISADNLKSLTLNKLLNPKSDAQMGQILSTMYTDEELNTDLEKGFYGHPNIGAPVFSYVRERFLAQKVTRADGTVQENTFMIDLHNTLSKGKAYVYLLGSLFGGTGATVIPNVVLALRTITDGKKNLGETNLVLGGSVVMPYFKLPVCPADSVEKLAKVVPADTKFAGQTRDALSYYHESGLLSNMMNLTLLGSSKLDVTSELFARGGVQSQHFHIVILLAAVAANRFFRDELGNMRTATDVPAADPVKPLGELLVWKASPENGGVYNSLTASELDLSEESKTLNQFLRFSVVVGYYMRLRFEQDPSKMKDWNEVLGTCRQIRDEKGMPLNPKKITKEQITKYYQEPVEKAGSICKGFIQFLYDVALTGYDWSGYHVKAKTPADNKNGDVGDSAYFTYEVTDAVVPTAAADFGTRWVDLANLSNLKDLLEATKLDSITSQKTLNGICSFSVLDEGRANVIEENYPEHIARVYEEALHKLGLEKNIIGKMKRDDVWFCEIYDTIRQLV